MNTRVCEKIAKNENAMIQQRAIGVENRSLHETVKLTINSFLSTLEDICPINLYDMVRDTFELPLLEEVMRYVDNNQSQAAELLGISRNTLRKKLLQHGMDESFRQKGGGEEI